MNLLEVLHLDGLSHGLANLSMFPYFDMAHYIMSVMALREQPGKFEATTSFIRHRDPLFKTFAARITHHSYFLALC